MRSRRAERIAENGAEGRGEEERRLQRRRTRTTASQPRCRRAFAPGGSLLLRRRSSATQQLPPSSRRHCRLQVPTALVALPPVCVAPVVEWARARLEGWLGRPVEPTGHYGPRVYANGSRLGVHTDSLATSALAAIVHVARAQPPTAAPWALHIQDHDAAWHRLLFEEAGEVVFYEGAKLLHGRPVPFDGEHYANLFLYFRPSDWEHTDNLI